MAKYINILGDNLDALKGFEDNSFDALVTDPPAGIKFMNHEFDSDRGGRERWINWLTVRLREGYRVLKPGGHAVIWALPKTAHWTETAVEQCGFEKRDRLSHFFDDQDLATAFLDSLTEEQRNLLARITGDESTLFHLFGQGAPKILDVSKAIDKKKGAKRKVVATRKRSAVKGATELGQFAVAEYVYSEPATEEAQTWNGWATNLKPAAEFWILVRKPLSEPTVAENIIRWGTGALNIGDSRIAVKDDSKDKRLRSGLNSKFNHSEVVNSRRAPSEKVELGNQEGRWPCNVVLSHTKPYYECGGCAGKLYLVDYWNEDNLSRCVRCSTNDWKFNPGCVLKGTKLVQNNSGSLIDQKERPDSTYGNNFNTQKNFLRHGGEDGLETVEDWDCVPYCSVKILDEQGGYSKTHRIETISTDSVGNTATYGTTGFRANRGPRGHNDQGGPSRFFVTLPGELSFNYQSKPAPYEKHAGCEDLFWKIDQTRPSGYLQISEEEWYKLGEHEEEIYRNTNKRVRLRARGNIHITVKSISLMEFFCKLICPTGGRILDMFQGSARTGAGALLGGFDYVGIDIDPDYHVISESVCKFWQEASALRAVMSGSDDANLKQVIKAKKDLTDTSSIQTKLF